ncbi:class II aldolase, partial [Verminephrobacter eiseniae]|nr:class II aldolase [Verminephrobacter eiseniae]
LGHQMSVAPAALARGGPALSDWLRAQRRSAGPAPLIAVPGRGVLLRDDLSEAACEMLTCLADVLQRLPPSGAPVYLPDEEAQALAHWEAEQFRQAQAR